MVCDDCKLVRLAISIEYEGCIMIGKGKSAHSKYGFAYHLQIQLTNTENDLLQWLVEDFGGGISIHRGKDGNLDSGHWQLYGDKASNLLLLLIPFFKLKKNVELAELAIEFQKGQVKGVNRTDNRVIEQEEFYLRAKKLNATGASSGDIIAVKANADTKFLGIEFDDLK